MADGMTFHAIDRNDSDQYVTGSHSFDSRGRHWVVRIAWDFVDLRWDPVSVEVRRIDGQTLRVTDLRDFPYARYVNAHREHLGTSLLHYSRLHFLEPGQWAFDEPTDFPEDRARLRDEAAAITGGKRRPRVTLADLDRVAAAYKRAKDKRMPVTEAVMAACGVSKSTAGKWIMRARDAGLLKGYEVQR